MTRERKIWGIDDFSNLFTGPDQGPSLSEQELRDYSTHPSFPFLRLLTLAASGHPLAGARRGRHPMGERVERSVVKSSSPIRSRISPTSSFQRHGQVGFPGAPLCPASQPTVSLSSITRYLTQVSTPPEDKIAQINKAAAPARHLSRQARAALFRPSGIAGCSVPFAASSRDTCVPRVPLKSKIGGAGRGRWGCYLG